MASLEERQELMRERQSRLDEELIALRERTWVTNKRQLAHLENARDYLVMAWRDGDDGPYYPLLVNIIAQVEMLSNHLREERGEE